MALASFQAKCYFLTTGTRATWGAADASGRHSGTAPSLTEIPNVGDIDVPLEKVKTEITKRVHGGSKAYKGTLKDVSIDIPMNYASADTGKLALQKAFLAGTTIALAFLEGDKATTGNEGFWADMEVVGMKKGEAIAGVQTIVFTVCPGDTLVPMEWVITA
jgi:hypothetical protein